MFACTGVLYLYVMRLRLVEIITFAFLLIIHMFVFNRCHETATRFPAWSEEVGYNNLFVCYSAPSCHFLTVKPSLVYCSRVVSVLLAVVLFIGIPT